MAATQQESTGLCAPVRGWGTHILALILLFTSLLSMSLIVFFSGPLPMSTSLPADQAGSRAWLFTLAMTDGQNQTVASKAMTGNGQLREVGFGLWGYCAWNVEPGPGDADCHHGAIWKVAYSDDVTDTAQYAQLPDAISQVLSGTGICLLIVWIIVLYLFLTLFIATYYPHPNLIMDRGDNSEMWQTGNWRVRTAILVGNTWRQIFAYIVIFLLIIPSLICVGIGIAAYSTKTTWKAGLGVGSDCLIATLISAFLAMLLIICPRDTGLWNNSHATARGPRDRTVTYGRTSSARKPTS